MCLMFVCSIVPEFTIVPCAHSAKLQSIYCKWHNNPYSGEVVCCTKQSCFSSLYKNCCVRSKVDVYLVLIIAYFTFQDNASAICSH